MNTEWKEGEEVIGWIGAPEHVHRETFETVSWWRESAMPSQTPDLVLKRHRFNGEARTVALARLSGVVTAANFCSRYDHLEIGRPHQRVLILATCDMGRWRAGGYGRWHGDDMHAAIREALACQPELGWAVTFEAPVAT